MDPHRGKGSKSQGSTAEDATGNDAKEAREKIRNKPKCQIANSIPRQSGNLEQMGTDLARLLWLGQIGGTGRRWSMEIVELCQYLQPPGDQPTWRHLAPRPPGPPGAASTWHAASTHLARSPPGAHLARRPPGVHLAHSPPGPPGAWPTWRWRLFSVMFSNGPETANVF